MRNEGNRRLLLTILFFVVFPVSFSAHFPQMNHYILISSNYWIIIYIRCSSCFPTMSTVLQHTREELQGDFMQIYMCDDEGQTLRDMAEIGGHYDKQD